MLAGLIVATLLSGCADADDGGDQGADRTTSTATAESSGPVDGSSPGCVDAYRQALTETYHFRLLTSCSNVDEYLASVQEVDDTTTSGEALRRLHLLCEMTDVGVQGRPEDYSPLCTEAYR
jgi:hypothetical protein